MAQLHIAQRSDIERAMVAVELLVADLCEQGVTDRLAIASALMAFAEENAEAVLGEAGMREWLQAISK